MGCKLAVMTETREFRAKAAFAVFAGVGYGLAIMVSLGYMTSWKTPSMWPANIVIEAVLIYLSTTLVLYSYVRLWVGSDGIVIRLPKGRRSILWADLAAYELSGRRNSICKLQNFEGTTIHFRFSSFENARELGQLIDSLAIRPI